MKTIRGMANCVLPTSLVTLSLITLATAPAWSEEDASSIVWTSTYTSTPPDVDGVIDGVWSKALPLEVTVREAFGGGDPKVVVLRALHTDDTFFVLAGWPDSTRSDMRDPYIWNADANEYERPTTPDDQFGLEFAISGDLQVDMLPTDREYTADVWHWKAGRSNLGGWVDDKRHIITREHSPGAREYSMGGRGTVYVARPMDKGQASYTLVAKPTAFAGERIASYKPAEPTESLRDVRGRGIHDGESWTLEMARKFRTGYSDDALIDPAKDNICAIAVLDDELYWKHSVSQLITLRFESALNR